MHELSQTGEELAECLDRSGSSDCADEAATSFDAASAADELSDRSTASPPALATLGHGATRASASTGEAAADCSEDSPSSSTASIGRLGRELLADLLTPSELAQLEAIRLETTASDQLTASVRELRLRWARANAALSVRPSIPLNRIESNHLRCAFSPCVPIPPRRTIVQRRTGCRHSLSAPPRLVRLE